MTLTAHQKFQGDLGKAVRESIAICGDESQIYCSGCIAVVFDSLRRSRRAEASRLADTAAGETARAPGLAGAAA